MSELNNIGDVLSTTLNELGDQVATLVPKLVGAAVVLFVGYVISKIIKSVITRLLSVGQVGETLNRKEVTAGLKKVGISSGLGGIIGNTVYWLIFLVFITASADIVGLGIVGETVDALFGYIPKVVSAIIVIVIAVLLSKVVSKAVAASLMQMQINFAGTIASVASSLIILFGAVMAVTQLGFDTELITTNITLLIAGFIATGVLAVGLGSKGAVANIVAGYHGQQMYKVGQMVKIGDVKGKVVAVSNVAVTVHHNGADEVISFNSVLNS